MLGLVVLGVVVSAGGSGWGRGSEIIGIAVRLLWMLLVGDGGGCGAEVGGRSGGPGSLDSLFLARPFAVVAPEVWRDREVDEF